MKTIIVLTACFLSAGFSYGEWNRNNRINTRATDYNSSPYNPRNSGNNYENSSSSWKNSPNRWENSKYNSRRKSVYNENGESVGYVVDKKDGGSNIYSNSGKRIGYVPKD